MERISNDLPIVEPLPKRVDILLPLLDEMESIIKEGQKEGRKLPYLVPCPVYKLAYPGYSGTPADFILDIQERMHSRGYSCEYESRNGLCVWFKSYPRER